MELCRDAHGGLHGAPGLSDLVQWDEMYSEEQTRPGRTTGTHTQTQDQNRALSLHQEIDRKLGIKIYNKQAEGRLQSAAFTGSRMTLVAKLNHGRELEEDDMTWRGRLGNMATLWTASLKSQ